MKRAGAFLGPVGLFFVSLGYTVSAGIARLFVTLESICTQHCPVLRVEGFRFHHMYYGVLLLGLTGFLYFDRPVRIVVEATALGAWLASAVLVTKFGRRHFFLLRNAPLNYPSPNR